jgi:hypothetical protein
VAKIYCGQGYFFYSISSAVTPPASWTQGTSGWVDSTTLRWVAFNGGNIAGSIVPLSFKEASSVSMEDLEAWSCSGSAQIIMQRSDFVPLLTRLGAGVRMTEDQLNTILARMDTAAASVVTAAGVQGDAVVAKVDGTEGIAVVGVVIAAVLLGLFFGWKAVGRGAGRSG